MSILKQGQADSIFLALTLSSTLALELQDLALARLHTALNGGAFENPWNANLRLQATPLENPGRVQGAPLGVHGGVQHTQAATQLEGHY
ncbi:hypothetical protein BGY98DRAFT_562482 [Russula aff. rugulosa BPL654]|nr:hypothetical protein BGY98DRAFT_562482 [Russula aff. rugulosa BPL654]